MTSRRSMPPAEVTLQAGDVAALVAEQFPELAGEPVTIMGHGWDNLLFRIGESHVGRFPRRRMAVELVRNESRWLPMLAPRLPLRIPAPVFVGQPGQSFPWPWTIVPFIMGEAAGETHYEPERTAEALGRFLACLHLPAPEEAPSNPYRGMHIAERDASTREGLESLSADARLFEAWERACRADRWGGPPLWLHGDLHPQNILIAEGVPSGVIDFGDITAGDPATDLAVGWMLFDATGRSRFFDAYGNVEDQTRERASGWAITLATSYVVNGADNEEMTRIGLATLSRAAS